jgi:hypothetical protein
MVYHTIFLWYSKFKSGLFTIIWMSFRRLVTGLGFNLKKAYVSCTSDYRHLTSIQFTPNSLTLSCTSFSLPFELRCKPCLVWSYLFKDDTSINPICELSTLQSTCSSLTFALLTHLLMWGLSWHFRNADKTSIGMDAVLGNVVYINLNHVI